MWSAVKKAQKAELELPKFSIRTASDLAGVLNRLGIDLDDPELLSGVFESARPSFVGPAIHEAVIDVDESETEAAAATAVIDTPVSSTETPPKRVFRVDQPFYFLLVERKTGLIARRDRRAADPANTKSGWVNHIRAPAHRSAFGRRT